MNMSRIFMLVLLTGIVLSYGCTGTQKGASGGALVGAGIGAVIGHQSGETGKGAALGAVIGGLAGALVGDQVIEDDEEKPKAQPTTNIQSQEQTEPDIIVEKKVKFCPVCGRIYPADMEYCPKDGAKLKWKED